MLPTPVDSVMPGLMGSAARSTDRLRRGQVIRLAGLGILLCISGALFIRYATPLGVFGGRAGIMLFVLSGPLAPTIIFVGKRVGGLSKDQLVPGIAFMSAVAMLCGGVALTWFPEQYGDNPANTYLGAAWLLFDVGVNLTGALLISIRGTS